MNPKKILYYIYYYTCMYACWLSRFICESLVLVNCDVYKPSLISLVVLNFLKKYLRLIKNRRANLFGFKNQHNCNFKENELFQAGFQLIKVVCLSISTVLSFSIFGCYCRSISSSKALFVYQSNTIIRLILTYVLP